MYVNRTASAVVNTISTRILTALLRCFSLLYIKLITPKSMNPSPMHKGRFRKNCTMIFAYHGLPLMTL